MKKFAKIYYVVIIVFFLFLVLWKDREEISDYSKIEAAGSLTLTPVDIKQTKTRTRARKGRTTEHINNYVKFRLKIEDKQRVLWISTSEAYGENSPSVGLSAVRNNKKIERYIFYTENNIYYSTTAQTVREYVQESIQGKIIIYVFTVGICVVIVFLGVKLGDRKLKKENQISS